MKRVYIAFYDGRVAGVFDTWQKCEQFVRVAVPGGLGKFGFSSFGFSSVWCLSYQSTN